ncbi:MAG: cell wall-active antibiotics response protein LiaF, partial [candidate division Zixibacteria bacterium]|nr:cell wall-active antibiotics response protein LiaF [candidate division Zixibacteria bacterium]
RSMSHRQTTWGLILIVLGGLLLLYNLHIVTFRYVWPAAIIVVGIYLLARGWRRRSAGIDICNCQAFGDRTYSGVTEIHNGNVSHFIGDVNLDLSGMELKPRENKITVSAFIGDIRLRAPIDIPVRAICSAFIADFNILGQSRDGIFLSITEQTPDYDAAEKKLLITCSVFIGDVSIQRG